MSLIVAPESVFITAAIDAHERRDIAVTDIPGAFLHTESDEKVLVILRGEMALALCEVAGAVYKPYLSSDKKGIPILYVELNKAMYGTLRAALQF